MNTVTRTTGVVVWQLNLRYSFVLYMLKTWNPLCMLQTGVSVFFLCVLSYENE